MSKNQNKHILLLCKKWLKRHTKALLGITFGVLACVQAALVADDMTNAYLLLRMKEPERIVIMGPRRRPLLALAETDSASGSSLSSSSSSSAASLRPAAPAEPASSAATSARGSVDTPPSSATSAASSAASSVQVSSEPSSKPSSAPNSSSSSVTSSATSVSVPDFPAFDHATMPVYKVPNWGDMRTPEEWNRSYGELSASDFVTLPRYNLAEMTQNTMESLQEARNDPESIRILTEKLTYSTRYFGAYDLDASEFSGIHPGVDIKLAEGTPVGAIGGGKVSSVISKEGGLGLHVIIEHRLPDGSQYFSIYGHLASVSVKAGDAVKPGQTIGRVGMTGKTTGPHLHLQIDVGNGEGTHVPYMPDHLPGTAEAARFVVHPILFIAQHLK